jgi:hypothetical protein
MDSQCRKKLSNCKTENCNTHAKDMHALFIDDLSEAEAINLKKQLMDDPTQIIMNGPSIFYLGTAESD